MTYIEATGSGLGLRDHGAHDDEGRPSGVIVEKVFESERHAPVEKQFGLDEGHALLDYIGHCLGMDHNGQIAVHALSADDEEEYSTENDDATGSY